MLRQFAYGEQMAPDRDEVTIFFDQMYYSTIHAIVAPLYWCRTDNKRHQAPYP